MMMRRILGLATFALTLCTLAAPAFATDAPDMAAMMKEYMRVAAPGEGHKALQPMIGEWSCNTKMWWGGPGTPGTEDTGMATFKWIMDGRFVQQDFTGTTTMPDATGKPQKMPMKGMGITGFDNFRNMYTTMWIDNMGTTMSTSSGSTATGSKTMHLYGEMDEPGMKVVGRMVHYELKWVDNDHFTFSMFDLHASPDYKVMEISYTRKKA